MNKYIKCYAILPIKGEEIEVNECDDTNDFSGSDNNIFIVSDIPQFNTLTNSNNNTIITKNVIPDCNTFIDRLKFCWMFLFKYQ